MQAVEERLETTCKYFETLDDFIEGFASFVEFVNKIYFVIQNKKRDVLFGVENDYYDEDTFLITSLCFLLEEVKKDPEKFIKTSMRKLEWMWLEIEGKDGLRCAFKISKNFKGKEEDLHLEIRSDSRMYMLGFFTCGFFFSKLLNIVDRSIPPYLLESLYIAVKSCYEQLKSVH